MFVFILSFSTPQSKCCLFIVNILKNTFKLAFKYFIITVIGLKILDISCNDISGKII